MAKRVFLIVLDSFGIGGASDAAAFGDEGSDTMASVAKSEKFFAPNLAQLGIFNIDEVSVGQKSAMPKASYARLCERSAGKDTTIGHWEIAGVESERALPVFSNGFPAELIEAFEEATGRKTICNKPYSGTDVIRDYGEEHMKTGALIVYTSADSVFQVAANEAIVPIEELYRYCDIARKLLAGDYAVGRVIARPFVGEDKASFKRTANRHDFSLKPPRKTVLDALKEAGKDVIAVGKINDIFAGQGITEKILTKNNSRGMQVTCELVKRDFCGLAFINLVEFDMLYGHRNDVNGYAEAITQFDKELGDLLPILREDDVLIITADHGCDPATPSTDHSRENVPLLIYGQKFAVGKNLGTRQSFGCIACTVAEYFGVNVQLNGESLLAEIT